MRKLFAVLVIVALAVGAWWLFFKDKSHSDEPKQQPLTVGKHSAEFNQSINSIVTAYLSLKDAFVNADTAKIKEQQRNFINVVDSVKLDDLKKDTSGIFQSAQMQISDIRSNA